MTNKERDKIIEEHKKDIEIQEQLEIDGDMKPHYIYINAILLDGKIIYWKVGMYAISLIDVDIRPALPKELKMYFADSAEKYREKVSENERRVTILTVPIWVNNLDEHNDAFWEAKKIYKRYPIHKNIIGEKPY